MEQIAFYLEKFKTIGADSIIVKRVFIESVQKVFGITLTTSDVVIKDGVVRLSAHPALKSELFLKKTLLLQEISKILGTAKIIAIR